MKIADLNKQARGQSMEVVSEQSRQSFPIPVMRGDGLHVLFFYYPAQALAGQPAKIGPPAYLLNLHATGRFVELRAITPKELGHPHQAGQYIGTYGSPEGLTSEQYFQKLGRLYHLYDLLLPSFATGRSGGDPELKGLVSEFSDLFQLLSERPLQLYYELLGKDFSAWLKKVSR